MSEKRFTTRGIIISHYGVWDTDDKPYANDDVVDLLNEQQSTIKYLTIEKHQADKRFQTIIAELKKENEQLKIANAKWLDKSLQDKQIRYDNSDHNELVHKYLQLKEENEQLKQKLENLDLNEKNDTVKMIDGKVFIKM